MTTLTSIRTWLCIPLLGLCATVYAEETTVTAHLDADGVQRATIVGGSYFFRPNHVIVKAHVPVELTVSVEADMIPHDFVLQSDEAKISIKTDLDDTPKKSPSPPRPQANFLFTARAK